jgi:hypothetical protein
MSGDDRRPGMFIAAEQSLQAAAQMRVGRGDGPIPDDYWPMMVESYVLATLASAPAEVAATVALGEQMQALQAQQQPGRNGARLYLPDKP